MTALPPRPARGLLMDYGGVLTGPVAGSFTRWEEANGVPTGRTFELLRSASMAPDGGLIGCLERGELSVDHVDERLRALLSAAGYEVPDGPLLDELFAGMVPAGSLWDVVWHARASGIRTGLLSNSWGFSAYPRAQLAEHFDATIISGEVGARKPEPEIYLLAAERLGLTPDACAFVDDLATNVEVAQELGMFGVVYIGDDAAAAEELEGFLDVSLPRPGSGVRGFGDG